MRVSVSCPHSAISGRTYVTQHALCLCSVYERIKGRSVVLETA
jgi:hypothetical protein